MLFIPSFIHADDIHLKNGNTIYNVQVIETTDKYYVVKTSADKITLFRDDIESIDKKPLTDPFLSYMLKKDGTKQYYSNDKNKTDTTAMGHIRPNLLMAPASAALFVLAYEYFNAASVIPDPNYKRRYNIYGIVFSISAITTLIYSIKSVTLTTDGKSISVSYNF